MPSPYVFISYKSEEVAHAQDLMRALEAHGVGSWAAFKDVQTSHAKEIKRAIQGASAVVILMSRLSYESDEVLDEVYVARKLKRLRLHILLPGEVTPFQVAGLSDDIKDAWELELTRRQLQPWGSADAVAAWVARAISDAERDPQPAQPVLAEPSRAGSPADSPDPAREPFALVSSLGMTYQLEGDHGLRQNQLDAGDPIIADDHGRVVIAPDGSVIATLNDDLEVAIWTLDYPNSLPGPALDDVLPPGQGTVRLLAIERPIGRAIRIVASRGDAAYSVIGQRDGTWASEPLATGDEEFVGGVAVVDDLLLVREGGDVVWAGDHAKLPFGLRSIRGVDSAFGPDGRQYLAAWGTGTDGSSQVEAVVESGGRWERVHRGPGNRAGIIRLLRDAARQSPAPAPVTIAVQSSPAVVELVVIGA